MWIVPFVIPVANFAGLASAYKKCNGRYNQVNDNPVLETFSLPKTLGVESLNSLLEVSFLIVAQRSIILDTATKTSIKCTILIDNETTCLAILSQDISMWKQILVKHKSHPVIIELTTIFNTTMLKNITRD